MGHIKAANLAKSKRLRSVLDFLMKRDDRGATTREIIEECHVCAVNSIISELRACGSQISCKTVVDQVTGGRICTYRLVSFSQEVPE